MAGLLRADLSTAGFTVARLGELWGERADAALHRGDRVPARRALAGVTDAAASLARLFVLGLPLDPGDAMAALPTLGIAGAIELGLVEVGSQGVVPRVDLRPYTFTDGWGEASWWIVSDLGEVARGAPLAEDHVLGVGGASLTLSGIMLTDPVAAVLDLGTGCGIQAMHASRHAGRVVATDISERALGFARLNAAINGIRNIEFRAGSLFGPVAGERFDQIVSNPPFVITPRTPGIPAYEYRDAGRVGDALVAEVVAGVRDHLNPGGIAQLLGNWEYRGDADGLERVRGWTAGLDAWVVEREVQDPAQYSETWIRDGGTVAGPEFDRLADAWLTDFEARGVDRVGFGYLTLRRPRAEQTLDRFERLDGAVAPGLGASIGATIAAHDWQASLDDGALSRALLAVAPDVTEERHYWPGDEHPAAMNLRQGGGFRRSYPLDTALAAVVGACDGELSIAAICAALAELLSSPGAPVESAELLAQVLPSIRELVTVGMLRRPEA